MGSFPQILCCGISLTWKREKDISDWAVTQGAKPPWDQGSETSLLRDRDLLIPSNKSAPPHELCSTRSQGPPCLTGHCVWVLKTNPTAQPQHCSAPKPSCVGQGEAGHPSHWGMWYWGRELTKICPMHRRAPSQRSPNWYRGNQPRKEETKWLHLIFTLLSLLSLLPLLPHIGDKGSSKAKSISKPPLLHFSQASYRVQLLHFKK